MGQSGASDDGCSDGLEELREGLCFEGGDEVCDIQSDDRDEVGEEKEDGVAGGADAAHACGEQESAKKGDFASMNALGELGPLGCTVVLELDV